MCSYNLPLLAYRCRPVACSVKEEVLHNLAAGFPLGFQMGKKLTASHVTSRSALDRPEVVEEYLLNEVREGAMAGPFPSFPKLIFTLVGSL